MLVRNFDPWWYKGLLHLTRHEHLVVVAHTSLTWSVAERSESLVEAIGRGWAIDWTEAVGWDEAVGLLGLSHHVERSGSTAVRSWRGHVVATIGGSVTVTSVGTGEAV